MKSRALMGLSASLLLGACSLAPPYSPPSVPTPPAYKEAVGPWRPADPTDRLPRGAWWTRFGDDTLNRLEPQLDSANADLAAAVARYDQSRAFAAEARAGMFPQVDAGASLSTDKQSTHRPLRATANSSNYYGANQIDMQVGYEIDLWGKIRNTARAGKDMSQASAADLASARLSLEAELATDYFSLRGLDADAQLLNDTVAAYQKSRDLTQQLFDGKLVGSMDVSRSETQLRLAKAQVADIASRRALLEHAIAVLIGQPPAAFSLPPQPVIQAPPEIPTGLPSVMLQRRPDIASAERQMAAANARIGVARAAMYPSLTIGLLGGTQSTNLSLLQATNSFWALGPSVSLPIFHGGFLRAQKNAAYASFDEMSANYRSTVLNAFAQVEDSLALLHWLGDESTQEDAAVQAAQHTLDVALNLYHQGADSYLDVVTAQTPLLMAQQQALDLRTRRVLAAVALVRALGGGWDTGELPS